MNISVTGISHQTAPVALRERFAFAQEELSAVLPKLAAAFDGAAVLSTCNRTEVYITNARPVEKTSVVAALSSARAESIPEGIDFYHLQGVSAAKHLFRVSAGIESLVVGESEILGQVRGAFSSATAAGSSNPVLARLFHAAIRAGRRARSETEIGVNGVSVSATAVALVRQALGDLHRKSVLVVGAGDAARLTAQALSGAGAGRILVSTRTLDRALDIATQLGAFAYPFEEMPHLLAEVDIVISSTSAASHVITREQVALAARARKRHPLVLVDIAVPRDIDPGVAELPNVRLFDIDDLQTQAEINRQNRLQEVEAVEAIVEQEVERFAEWLRQHGATPTIAGLRSRAEAIRAAEVQRTLARLPDLTAADRKRIESMSQAILKRLLHEPVTRLKDGAEQHHIDAIRELFALDKDAQK